MPAYDEEIEEARAEGVEIRTLVNPVEIIASNGKVSGVRCQTMTLGSFDKTGRRRPVTSEESFVIDADQVIFACGQTLDVESIFRDIQIETVSSGRIKTDPVTGQTSVPWIFSGGDSATGPLSIVEAVAGGERAAVGIDEFLSGSAHAFWRTERKNDTFFDPDADPSDALRERQPVLAINRRVCNFDEVELSWTENETIRQAKRCLRCDFGKGE
jgi:NADH-quinone oxidoreductase subunit F